MELFLFGVTMGAILTVIAGIIGVLHEQRNNQRQSDPDSDMRIYVPDRDRDRSGDHRRAEWMAELSDEAIANMLRAMCITGICPSHDEKEYLQEAAQRLERRQD